MESPITEFYRAKTVFVTGVTGFVAKSVVEKLLRYTDVKKVYVLMREKKGKEIQARMEDIKRNVVFDRLRIEKKDTILDKLVPIAGDVGFKNLNLSESDEKTLVENVNVVVHSAAALDFEMSAKLIINVNFIGTKRILSLCTKMRNLQAFVYVSTAYVNADKSFVLEKLYSRPCDVDNYLAVMKINDRHAEQIVKKLMNGHINPYTMSKAFAEHEVDSFCSSFPVAIVRPSIIVGAWKEPFPGWTDSKNGPSGFFMGAGLGVVRRLPVNKYLVCDYIPVDIVTNELIAAAWKVGTSWQGTTHVYHCTSSTVKPFSWNILEPKINALLTTYPLQSAVWYPTIKLHKNFTLFRISTLFFHFLPGIFFDILLKLSGKKPILFKLHYRVDSSLRRLAPFIFKEWFFDNTNTDDLHKSFTEKDRIIFNLDIRDMNYEKFFENAVKGARRCLNKESDDTLVAARKKVKIFYFFHCLLQILFFSTVWWVAAAIFKTPLISCSWIVLVAYFAFSCL